ncbi:large conductance mechanosensitive channel [Lactobacillus colini]|uniref:Large-conductance mechanosensitive channel n=1 Tax=Lactobacillus colini TaxID=1819254 RepID=A0ABS4MEG4_9LACO|nr:large-conductance mechanosensitive channel protein MscL [Lactobacillus colini]MBP2058073.1 large conductance mechanosensitive channel [Lactobacillus colini]
MLKEFKEFISRGDVMNLAVGVIIGSAFTAIVNSLVTNLINPLIGLFVGRIDLSNLVLKVGDATFKYGKFINAVINFLIIAFIVFLLMKMVNKLMPKKKEEPAEPEPTQEEVYLREIRDLLAEQKKSK